jgi:predicted AAA+ superfamily ATPase
LIHGILRELFKPSETLFISFNISIKNEIKRKLKNFGLASKIEVRTFDSIVYELAKIADYKYIDLPNFEGKRKFVYELIFNKDFTFKPDFQPKVIFLDEVQNIPKFEKLVDGLFASENTDVYITGSNAFLLSSELATLLSGRYIEISILPFSFHEYLIARNIVTSDKYLNYEALFFDYINETSLPKGVELRESGFDKIYEYLEAIYTTIIEKDITQRHRINDKRAFANIVKFIATNIGNALSPSNISKTLKQDGQSIHHLTIEKYLEYLTASFVFYKVNRFDIKGKKQLATQEKYYLVDAGLLNILVGKERVTDRGHILENVVFLELLRRGYKIWTGTSRNSEVDFVCKTPSGDIEYYQVAWQMSDEKTLDREFGSLEKINDNYPKYILTTDSFTINRSGVKHLNVFNWLLGGIENEQ